MKGFFFCYFYYQVLAGARNFPPDFIRGFHQSPRFKGLEPLDSISGSIKKNHLSIQSISEAFKGQTIPLTFPRKKVKSEIASPIINAALKHQN
jgi:hypothetical protein